MSRCITTIFFSSSDLFVTAQQLQGCRQRSTLAREQNVWPSSFPGLISKKHHSDYSYRFPLRSRSFHDDDDDNFMRLFGFGGTHIASRIRPAHLTERKATNNQRTTVRGGTINCMTSLTRLHTQPVFVLFVVTSCDAPGRPYARNLRAIIISHRHRTSTTYMQHSGKQGCKKS